MPMAETLHSKYDKQNELQILIESEMQDYSCISIIPHFMVTEMSDINIFHRIFIYDLFHNS